MYPNIDRRRFGRRTVRQHAWVIVSRRARLPCLVLNLSGSGAFLEFEVPPWLPHSFNLLFEEGTVVRGCEVRHFGKTGVGVTLVEPHAVEPPQPLTSTTIIDTGSWTGSDQAKLGAALASRRRR